MTFSILLLSTVSFAHEIKSGEINVCDQHSHNPRDIAAQGGLKATGVEVTGVHVREEIIQGYKDIGQAEFFPDTKITDDVINQLSELLCQRKDSESKSNCEAIGCVKNADKCNIQISAYNTAKYTALRTRAEELEKQIKLGLATGSNAYTHALSATTITKLISKYGTDKFYPHELTDLFQAEGSNLHKTLHSKKLIDVVGKQEEGNFDKDGAPSKKYHHDHVDGAAFKKWIAAGDAHFVQIPYGLNIPIKKLDRQTVTSLTLTTPSASQRLLLSANPESRRLDGKHIEHKHLTIGSNANIKVTALLIEDDGKFKLYNINNEFLKSTYRDKYVIAYVPHEDADHSSTQCPNHSHLESLNFPELLWSLFEKIKEFIQGLF